MGERQRYAAGEGDPMTYAELCRKVGGGSVLI